MSHGHWTLWWEGALETIQAYPLIFQVRKQSRNLSTITGWADKAGFRLDFPGLSPRTAMLSLSGPRAGLALTPVLHLPLPPSLQCLQINIQVKPLSGGRASAVPPGRGGGSFQESFSCTENPADFGQNIWMMTDNKGRIRNEEKCYKMLKLLYSTRHQIIKKGIETQCYL